MNVWCGSVSKNTVSISGYMALLVCAMALSYSKSAAVRSPLKIYLAFSALQKSIVSPVKVFTSTLPSVSSNTRLYPLYPLFNGKEARFGGIDPDPHHYLIEHGKCTAYNGFMSDCKGVERAGKNGNVYFISRHRPDIGEDFRISG